MKKSILIVDDEPSIRKVLSAHLTRAGYAVTTAHSGTEAISVLHEEAFHLVVSDLRMPGVDGMELLAARAAWVVRHLELVCTLIAFSWRCLSILYNFVICLY